MAVTIRTSRRALRGPGRRSGVPRAGTDAACRTTWAWLLGVLMLALVTRAIHIHSSREVPFIQQLSGDAAGYYSWALDISEGNWLGEEAFYQAPLYPYCLALGMKVLGKGVATIRVVQAIGGVVSVMCLAIVGYRLFGRRVGIVCGVMLAFYGPAVFFDGVVQKTSLVCLLLCVLLWSLSAVGGRALFRACVVGFLAALLVLTRENAIVWLGLLAVWLWLLPGGGSWRPRVGGVVFYVVGVAVVLVPVGVRNVVVGGQWSMSTFQAGPNFYIGNGADADGRYRPLVRGHETPAFERRDATELAERALGRTLSPREVSRYWMRRAVEEIKVDPLRWLRLMGIKSLMVWNAYEVSDVESIYVYTEYSPVLRILVKVWHFGVLCPLAAVGLWASWPDRRRLWIYYALILSMAGSVTLFYVLARYRFPLAVLLIPFAAAGCVAVWDRLRGGCWRSLVTPAILALAVAAVVNWPIHDERRLGAMAYSNLGSALGAQGELEGAVRYLQLALDGHPGSAEAHFNLAYALSLQGRLRQAIEHYRAALDLEATLMHADYLMAVALEAIGHVDEAMEHYERAIALDPANAEAREALARFRGP